MCYCADTADVDCACVLDKTHIITTSAFRQLLPNNNISDMSTFIGVVADVVVAQG
jgi:hypothetical protein